MKKKLTMLAAACAATVAFPAHALVSWSFNYTDVGVGFNDPTQGLARQGELQSAADYVSSFLTSYTANLYVDVNGSITTDTTLASAGSNYTAPYPGTGFGDQGDIMRKILGGDVADPSPALADGEVNWNFEDFSWSVGNTFPPGAYDFFSTAVHELLHALGFLSGIQENGDDYWSHSAGTPGAWTPFDAFLTDFSGTALIDGTTFVLDQTKWDAAKLSDDGNGLSGCGAGIQFTGANAVAANGGNPVQIYSPKIWEGGSSGSHLDDACYTIPGNVSTYMMEAQTIDGLGVRTISALEVGLMKDIGYTNFGVQQPGGGSVPEPGTLYLLLGALGLLGLMRRNKAA